MGKFNILSFDGGGIRGLYSATLLDRLRDLEPTLISKANLFTGTSTGGLIALALACGLDVDAIIRLYQERAHKIFSRSLLKKIFSPFNLTQAKYDNKGLIREVEAVFGKATLKDLRRMVVVPAFDLKSEASPENPKWRVEFFNNVWHTDWVHHDMALERVSDIGIRTASAPTYFPTYQGYVDGGVAANDPALVAVAVAMGKLGVRFEDISILSIGTGGTIRHLDIKNSNWGGLKWLKPALSILMDAQELVTDYQCKSMFGDRYHRLTSVLPDIPMDDLSRRNELVERANAVDLSACTNWIRNHW
jgi:patatin-like phospholipase/acyl hydrolase